MGAGIGHIGDLRPDPKNARKHNPRNIGMIEDSLHEVGAARSIVIDENGIILAGNGLVEAAAQAGIERVQVVDADGETIIAVRRTGLTAKQKRRLALFDNRTAELAGWEPVVLSEMVNEDPEVFRGMFSKGELEGLLYGPNDPNAEWQGMPEFEHEDQTAEAAFIIRVFLKNADDLTAFGRLLGKDLTGKKFVWFSKQPHGDLYEAYDEDPQ